MDLIVTSTGNVNVCDKYMLQSVKSGAVICNIGHFDNEIDTQYMRDNWHWEEVKPQVHKSVPSSDPSSNKDDYLDAVVGRTPDQPGQCHRSSFAELWTARFANQVLAQIYLYEKAFASQSPDQQQASLRVEVLPKHLDEEVAALMVSGFGGVMTKADRTSSRVHQCTGQWSIQN